MFVLCMQDFLVTISKWNAKKNIDCNNTGKISKYQLLIGEI